MRRAALLLLLAFLVLLGFTGAAVAGDDGDDGEDGDDDGGDGGRGGDGRDDDKGDRKGRGDGDGDRKSRDGDGDGHGDDEDDEKGEDGDRHAKEERKQREGRDREDRRDRPRSDGRPGHEPGSTPAVPVRLEGDAAVRQVARTEPGRLTYVLSVGGLGPAPVHDVDLAAQLPDVGSSWSLSGLGADSCSVGEADLLLSCGFGDLLPGEVRIVQAVAVVEAAPAWQLETLARLEAQGDRDAANDSAKSIVGILLT